MFQSPSKRQKATKVPPQDTIAASIPTKSTHDSSEQHYDTLDKFCSEYILIGPGGYDTKEEEERVLTSIKVRYRIRISIYFCIRFREQKQRNYPF